jgi:hypothetical protein
MIRGPGREWAGTSSSEAGRIVVNFPARRPPTSCFGMNGDSRFHSHSGWGEGLLPRCMISSVFIRKRRGRCHLVNAFEPWWPC